MFGNIGVGLTVGGLFGCMPSCCCFGSPAAAKTGLALNLSLSVSQFFGGWAAVGLRAGLGVERVGGGDGVVLNIYVITTILVNVSV